MSDENQVIGRNRINSKSYSSQNELLGPIAQSIVSSSQKSSSNNLLLCPPEIKPRKHSLPLIYPNQLSPNEYLENTSNSKEGRKKSFPSTLLDTLDLNLQKHRLSQVGIAVSQHLSTNFGLKLISSHNQIVKQSQCLCSRFIRFRLRKEGLTQKRFNLQKLRNFCNIRVDSSTSLVATELNCLIHELEKSNPKLFTSVVNNLSQQSFTTINEIQSILQLMSQELFRNDITWARIAALFAITGALAVDSVQMGRPEYIIPIIESFTAFVDRDIADWIAQQGGWESLIFQFRIDDNNNTTFKYLLISLGILFWTVIAYFMI